MTKSTKKAGLVVKSSVKAGGFVLNHNRTLAGKKAGLVVKSTVKAGGFVLNHSRAFLA